MAGFLVLALSYGVPPLLSGPILLHYTVILPSVSRDAPSAFSYTTLERASRMLLSSKKPANRVLPLSAS
jgi:hypothetical protein